MANGTTTMLGTTTLDTTTFSIMTLGATTLVTTTFSITPLGTTTLCIRQRRMRRIYHFSEMANGATTLVTTTFSIMMLGATTLATTTFSITPLGTMTLGTTTLCICHLPFAEANGKTLHSLRANDRRMKRICHFSKMANGTTSLFIYTHLL